MLGRLDNYLQFNEAALSLREKRQAVLASNIANADKQGRKLDIVFRVSNDGVAFRYETAGGTVRREATSRLRYPGWCSCRLPAGCRSIPGSGANSYRPGIGSCRLASSASPWPAAAAIPGMSAP